MSSCDNCGTSGSQHTFGQQYFYSNQPNNCGDDDCGSNSLNAKCVYYAGPNLGCSGINTNDSIELSLQKMDEKLCAVLGDYSAYNFNCLDDGGAITTEGEFVSAVSSYVCTLRSDFNTFTLTTFPAYQATVNTRFTNIEVPGITNPGLLIGPTDTLAEVLDTIAGSVNDIYGEIDPSGVNWSQCFSVPTPPATVAAALAVLADQICQVKALNTNASLPTFNNTGTCLATPGAADSLVDTITKIRTRVCLSPVLNTANLTSSCIAIPATATDLEGTLNNILAKIDTLSQAIPSFDGADFVTSAADAGDPCAGVMVNLGTPLNQDRFVAANGADNSPGTLIAKLVGVGITIDDTTNPGQITLTSVATADTYTVLAGGPDTTPGVLDAKVQGQADPKGVTIVTNYNNVTKKLDVTPVVDGGVLWDHLLYLMETDSTLKSRLCALIATCPSPCDPPTNAQAIAVGSTTTTTTTTV